MPTARIQLRRPTGAFNVKLTLLSPGDATWDIGTAIDHPGPANDPGHGLALVAWRDAQSTKFRRVDVEAKTIYVETDYGEPHPYELWLSIRASTNFVNIKIDKSLGSYDFLGDFYINSGVVSVASPATAGMSQKVVVQLW